MSYISPGSGLPIQNNKIQKKRRTIRFNKSSRFSRLICWVNWINAVDCVSHKNKHFFLPYMSASIFEYFLLLFVLFFILFLLPSPLSLDIHTEKNWEKFSVCLLKNWIRHLSKKHTLYIILLTILETRQENDFFFSVWQVGDVTRQIFLVIGRHMYFYCTILFLFWDGGNLWMSYWHLMTWTYMKIWKICQVSLNVWNSFNLWTSFVISVAHLKIYFYLKIFMATNAKRNESKVIISSQNNHQLHTQKNKSLKVPPNDIKKKNKIFLSSPCSVYKLWIRMKRDEHVQWCFHLFLL